MTLRRKIFLGLLILLIILLTGLFYYLRYILPPQIKEHLLSQIANLTLKPVSLEEVGFSLSQGIYLRGLTLYEDKETLMPFLKIPSLTCKPFPLIIFTQKKILIPRLTIDNPFLHIVIEKEGRLNIESILKRLKIKKPQKEVSWQVLVKEIEIKNLSIGFEDVPRSFKKTIPKIDLSLNLSLPQSINFKGNLYLKPSLTPHIQIKGRFLLIQKTLKGSLSLKSPLQITEYRPYLKILPLKIKWLTLTKAELNIQSKEEEYQLKGELQFNNIQIKKDSLKFKGGFVCQPNLSFNLKDKSLTYKLENTLENVEIDGLPYIKKITNLEGKLSIQPELIWAPLLKGKILKQPFNSSLTLKNFTNPLLNLEINLKLAAEKIKDIFLLPSSIKDISGNLNIWLKAQGPLKEKDKLSLGLDIILEEGTILLSSLKNPLKNVYAEINLKPGELSWKNTHLTLFNIPLNTEGKIENFKSPQVWLRITSEKDTDLKINFESKEKIIKDIDIQGKIYNFPLSLQGYLDIRKSSSPYLESQGNILVALEKLKSIPFLNPAILEKINPQGELNLLFSIKGNPSDWSKLEITAKGNSSKLNLYNLEFKNPVLYASLQEGQLLINPFQAEFYEGKVDLSSRLLVKEKNFPTTVKVILEKANLSKLIEALPFKNKELSGSLSFYLEAELPQLTQINSLRGEGKMAIKNGKIWELNLLKGLGEFLFIPEYENIIFNNGYAQFSIKEENIFFEEILLSSYLMSLEGKGSLSFKGDLNLLFLVNMSPQIFDGSENLKKIITSFLGEAGLTLEIKGNLKKPSYRLKPSLPNPLRMFKNFIEEITK